MNLNKSGGKSRMSKTVLLFSEIYCPTKLSNAFSAGITETLWREIMQNETAGRSFLRIESNGKDWICPIGQPISEENLDDAVFLPSWMTTCAGFQGTGEAVSIYELEKEAFPEARKLTLRVLDSAFYNSHVKEELERALSHLGVLKKHTLLQIPVNDLGGYEIEVFVANTEPADIVLCEGDEVVVEFEEPVDQIQPPRPPTPIPVEPQPLPDFMHPPMTFQEQTTGFVPFQGEGYLLGGSNANIPEWRKNLPPKKRS
jgi:hypothetical protein